MNFFSKSKNWSFFTNMTHSKNSSLLNLFIWLKELNTCFWNMTQWIELFSIWLKELNPFLSLKRIEPSSFSWRKELNPFFGDSIEHFSVLIHRIEHSFWTRLTELNSFFGMWLKEFNRIFKSCSKNWTPFTWRQRIEPSLQNDSKNWTFLKIIWLQDKKFFMTREMEPFSIWIKELRLFFFSTISHKNDWPFLNMTLRIEPFFNILTELNPFKNMIHRDWTLLFNMTQRKWVHFLVWLQE